MVSGSRLSSAWKYVVLAVVLVAVLFPVYWLATMSVKTARELSALTGSHDVLLHASKVWRGLAKRKVSVSVSEGYGRSSTKDGLGK